MKNPAPEERRTFERILVKLSLRYSFLDSDKKWLAKTHDISAQGISLILRTQLKPHTPVQVWLQLPHNEQPIYLEGEVVWSDMVDQNKHIAGICLEKADLMMPLDIKI
jgi:hypothetical protein